MRNKWKYTWMLIALAIGSPAWMAAQRLVGEVVTDEKGEGVEYATVFLEGTPYGTTTREDGRFSLEGIPAGTYWLAVAGVGYSTKYLKVDVPAAGSTRVAVALKALGMHMPEVVVQAQSLTGGGAGLRQVPGAAHYISPEEIRRFQYSDVHRLLQRVPGVNVQEEDGYGLRPNIGMRGTGVERSSKITIMEDGVLTAPAPYAAPAAYYFPSIGRMQGVEVMKGGSQVRFGPYTTGGAINLISTDIPADRMARVRLQAGNYGFRQVHAAAGQQFGRIGVMGEIFQVAGDGFKRLPGDVETPISRTDYLAKARWTSDPSRAWFQSVQLKAGQSRERSNETYLGLTAGDFHENPYQRYTASAEDQITTDHKQYSVQYTLANARHWNFQGTAYRNDFYRNWYKMDYVNDVAGEKHSASAVLDNPGENARIMDVIRGANTQGSERVAVKANQREYYSQGLQFGGGYRFTSGEWRHRVDFGYRYHEDQMDRFQWVDLYGIVDGAMSLAEPGTPGTESNRIESARAHASFVQYRLEGEKWTIIPGLRYEDITIARLDYGKGDVDREGTDLKERENAVQVFIPGVGIHYAFDEQTGVFGGVHRGFAPPGSQPETQPEISINYELGARREWTGGLVQLTGYYNDYTNLLGADLLAGGGSGTQNLFNGGAANIYGLEWMAEWNAGAAMGLTQWALPLHMAYTYSYGAFDNAFESTFGPWGTVEKGDRLPYLSPHQLAWSAGVERGQVAVYVQGKWNSDMRTVAGQGDIAADRLIPAYHVLDLSAQWHCTPELSLSVRAQNVTDEVYLVARRPAGMRPGMPRHVLFGLQWNLAN